MTPLSRQSPLRYTSLPKPASKPASPLFGLSDIPKHPLRYTSLPKPDFFQAKEPISLYFLFYSCLRSFDDPAFQAVSTALHQPSQASIQASISTLRSLRYSQASTSLHQPSQASIQAGISTLRSSQASIHCATPAQTFST